MIHPSEHYRQKCSPGTLHVMCKVHADIRGGFVGRGGLKRPWDSPNQRFLVVSVDISSEPVELNPILLCSIMNYLVGFPVTLKN